jgi:hypothetical protein
MGGLCPLFFDGAICQFEELPRPDDRANIQKIYNYLDLIRNNSKNKVFFRYKKSNSKKLKKVKKIK